MIRSKKKTNKLVSALSAVIAVVMLGTTVFASGVLSDMTTDDYTVEVTKNGEKIELINKSFIENGEVYIPLREVFEKTGVMEHPDSKILWDNGKIDLQIAQYVDDVEVIEAHKSLNNDQGVEIVTVLYNYQIEIGISALIENSKPNLAGQDVSKAKAMNNAPVLKNGVAYIPYSYVDYMFSLGENRWNISYSVYDKDGNVIYLDSFYYQVPGEYSIKIPDSWSGKYAAKSSGNIISFVQNATYEKYGEGSGTLFRIEKASSDRAEEILNMLGGSKLLYRNDDYAYIFEVPTDVQYPIWTDRDEEDIAIAAEYEEMFADIDFIANSFDVYESTEIMSYEPEPEIFNDPYSDFLITNYEQAMAENNLHGTYSYEYVRHWYNGDNNKVDFYYQIKLLSEDETQYLKMSFEKHGNEWTMYHSDIIREITADLFN